MSSADFPRRYLPADFEAGSWERVEPLFAELESREVVGAEAAVRWIEDQSELAAGLSEERTRRYVAMSSHTDDPEIAAAYTEYIEKIGPRCEPRFQVLRERFVELGLARSLPERYAVLARSVESEVRLFRQENVPLQTEDKKLDQVYGQRCAAMTVQYAGEERTLPQMGRYLEETDRVERESAWRAVAERRAQDRAELDRILDEMVQLRHTVARNAGHENFRDYQFEAYQRFDYRPEDCEAFHQAIEEVAVPARNRRQERRRAQLGLEKLRPWDLSVDPENEPPLRPFAETEELAAKCEEVFRRLDPELGGQFGLMRNAGWLDLDSRKGKAPGGYQASFDEHRHPFIFMNAAGMQSDVRTLLHEGGHAFHSLACREDPLVAYRHSPIEFAEVASMSMEMLALDHYDVFYESEERRRATIEQLERVLDLFPSVATFDAFQHWMYTHPEHDREARTEKWLELSERFGGTEDWSGLETIREFQWQRVLHLYSVPFYYVEYGIAQIGALQMWCNAREDRSAALQRYREALAIGGSRPLPQLWDAAGLRFDFGVETLKPLIEAVEAELEALQAPSPQP